MYALNYATKENKDGDVLACYQEHEKLYLEEANQRNICAAAEMAYALSAKEARTEENKLSEKVNWNALLEMDFTNQTVTQFLKDWNEYRKDPSSFEDQNGLMQLREAWYKFFDDNIADFSKARKLLKDKKIQKAATRLLDRYFLNTK